MPLLTIVIPTLNRAALLRRAIASALAQTRPDVEVLVSDNGSRDDTPAVIEAQTDARLRTFRHERTMPPIAHGAFVAEQVRTPYALFLSDDDHLEPAFAERTLARYEHDPALAFVHTRVRVESPAEEVLSRPHPAVMDGWELLAEFLRGGHGPAHCATVYRADDVRAALRGLPDDVLLGDMFLWPSLAPRGRVGYVDEPLSRYTWHGGNMTASIALDTWVRDLRLARARWDAAAERYGLPAGPRRRLAAAADRYLARGALGHLWMRAQSGAGKAELARELAAHRAVVAAQPGRAAVRALAMLALPGGALRAIRRARLAAAPG
jgi:glycosyltransferase involved in cell wall biosynthesis